MATLAELLRQGADKLVNLPSEAQRFITNPQAFTQLLTGKNPMPRETGFAAGATGLTPTDTSVLDPNQMEYMKGYEQGEPFAIAAMAAPLAVPAAKVLAPKAAQMAENYMVQQGFMPSIVAYHGTPHTIRGQFDINKVGTGEGAQAYGHGMYFAEAPEVAKQYFAPGKHSHSIEKLIDDIPAKSFMEKSTNPIEKRAADAISRNPTAKDAISYLEQDASFDPLAKKAIEWLTANESRVGTPGNLYKVDIPDADIPMMLDWDKPLSQQPKVMGALRSEAEQRVKDRTLVNIENDIRSSLPPIDIGNDYMAMFSDANVKAGQEIKKQALEKLNKMDLSSLVNKELESMKPLAMNWNMTGKEYYEFLSKNQGSPAKASEMLQRQGITGNRYLDEGSRNRGQGTSNFVVFEPSTVKILEKNNKPVTRKELIEKQVKALKE